MERDDRVYIGGIRADAALIRNERGEPVAAIDSRGNLGIVGSIWSGSVAKWDGPADEAPRHLYGGGHITGALGPLWLGEGPRKRQVQIDAAARTAKEHLRRGESERSGETRVGEAVGDDNAARAAE